MRGKVACVTGANSGIGYCVAKSLAERNCTVHMLCRNKARGEDARNRVLSATRNEDVHLHVVDVSDFEQVIHSSRLLTFILVLRSRGACVDFAWQKSPRRAQALPSDACHDREYPFFFPHKAIFLTDGGLLKGIKELANTARLVPFVFARYFVSRILGPWDWPSG